MKSNSMVLAAVLMTAIASPGFGHPAADPTGKQVSPAKLYSEADIQRFEKNYRRCLVCANDGVVESAIANTVRMKWAVPSAHLDELKATLGSLAADGPTVAIRYKACLAEMVFDSPSTFAEQSGQKYAGDDELFTAITVRLQQALFGYDDGSPATR